MLRTLLPRTRRRVLTALIGPIAVCASAASVSFSVDAQRGLTPMADVTLSPPRGGLFVRADSEFAPGSNPSKLHYGIAAADLDGDGEVEFVIAGYNGPNLVLKWDSESKRLVDISSHPAFAALRDPEGAAIGVACGDVDGDGVEEVYILNTNGAYAGSKSYGDKLFKRGPSGIWYDVLEDPDNASARNQFAGRSVAMVDRLGTGRYSVYVSNYASLPSLFGSGHRDRGLVGAVKLLEMDAAASAASGKLVMRDVAADVGVRAFTGGRGVTAAPLLPHAPGAPTTDILAVNERGPNFLFRNDGPKGFTDVAAAAGLEDTEENGRGVAVVDLENRGILSIVYGNWMGPHRMMLRRNASGGATPSSWHDVATPAFAEPSPVRTVVAADFANEGRMSIFVNNIAYRGPSPNRLFRWAGLPTGSASASASVGSAEPSVTEEAVGRAYQPAPIGDAAEPHGHGTGAAYADIDGDGNLELLVAHGESAEQPLSFYRVAPEAAARPVVQVAPLTLSGAPARGALVTARWRDGSKQAQVIDGGSGYLCEMWPVAHFSAVSAAAVAAGSADGGASVASAASAIGGAGAGTAHDAAGSGLHSLEGIDITWPDGVSVSLPPPLHNHRVTVPHPSAGAASAPVSRPLRKSGSVSA